MGMEAFHMGVFPGRTRLDVPRPNLGLLQPALERLGHEFRPVVAAKVLRFAATADHNFFQGVENPSGWEATSCFEQQAFPGVFVQNGEYAHGASIGRAVLDEVVAPMNNKTTTH